jgi:hypothetical protein
MAAKAVRSAPTSTARPLSKLARAARAAERLGVDDVGDRRRGVQFHLAVEEGSPRELARLGEAGSAGEHGPNDLACEHRRTVNLQLQQIFAGVALRRREEQR